MLTIVQQAQADRHNAREDAQDWDCPPGHDDNECILAKILKEKLK